MFNFIGAFIQSILAVFGLTFSTAGAPAFPPVSGNVQVVQEAPPPIAQQAYRQTINPSNSLPQSLTTQSVTDAVSVPGMSKYTDTDFGFSFWYPSGWSVTKNVDSAATQYGDKVLKKEIIVAGSSRQFTFDEYTSDTYTFAVQPGACGYCGAVKFYFDTALHQWMKVYPNGPNGAPDATPQQVTEAMQPQLADISRNTMGGLHMFSDEQKYGGTILPLSARNFLYVVNATDVYSGGTNSGYSELSIAQTITATDPSVATPVSTAEQVKTIQAEKDAYAGQ